MGDKPDSSKPDPGAVTLAPPRRLAYPLQKLFDEEVKVYDLLKGQYRQLEKDAREGKPITATDIRQIEDTHLHALQSIDTRRAAAITSMVKAHAARPATTMAYKPPPDPTQLEISYLVERKLHLDGMEQSGFMDFLSDTSSRGLLASFRETIRRDAMAAAKLPPVPPGASGKDFVIGLLKDNPGVALADIHTHEETTRFIATHMADFKKAGVDTVYIESVPEDFAQFDKLTAPQLRELQKTGRLGDIELVTAAQQAEHYHSTKADETARSFAGMLAAAKEEGIRVVPVDKPNLIRDAEDGVTSGDHRIATTNFTWTAIIRGDRTSLQAQGKQPGKYLVFAGGGHFSNDGMVDEALGIPQVAFTRFHGSEKEAVVRGNLPGGADYYLNGGADYHDSRLDQLAEIIQKFGKKLVDLPDRPILNDIGDRIETAGYDLSAYVYEQGGAKPLQVPDFPVTALPMKPSQRER